MAPTTFSLPAKQIVNIHNHHATTHIDSLLFCLTRHLFRPSTKMWRLAAASYFLLPVTLIYNKSNKQMCLNRWKQTRRRNRRAEGGLRWSCARLLIKRDTRTLLQSPFHSTCAVSATLLFCLKLSRSKRRYNILFCLQMTTLVSQFEDGFLIFRRDTVQYLHLQSTFVPCTNLCIRLL